MGVTVAVVDDEPRIRSLYATWVEERHEAVQARNGETALDAIDDEVDVVLLDRRMPDYSGDEVLSRLRERGYDGWVVMVTAVDPGLDITEMPFDDYLVKPVDKATLHRAIDVVTARSDYDDQVAEYFRVLAKLGVLETELSRAELAESDEYARLRTEQLQIKDRLSEITDRLDARDAYDDLFLDPPSEQSLTE
jgi:DNA-binding response OmpR family regulator